MAIRHLVVGASVGVAILAAAVVRPAVVATDAATEAYSTNGVYAVNEVLPREATSALRFCSVNGIHLSVGFHELDARNGCLEVSLPWTGFFAGPSSWSRSSGRSTTSGS